MTATKDFYPLFKTVTEDSFYDESSDHIIICPSVSPGVMCEVTTTHITRPDGEVYKLRTSYELSIVHCGNIADITHSLQHNRSLLHLLKPNAPIGVGDVNLMFDTPSFIMRYTDDQYTIIETTEVNEACDG